MASLKNIKPISYIKANAAKVLDHVNESHAPYIVTQNGEARGVILDVDSYQKMQDAFALLRLLQISEKDVQAGRTKPAKQVFQELRKELNAKK
jgi:prevent-host-death family protein